jgi:hypothetical protein
MCRHLDERGLILNWLMKILIFMGVVSFALFNAGAIAVNVVGLSSTADDIAVEVSTTLAQGPSMQPRELQAEASRLARRAGAKLVGVWVDDSRVLHVKLKRRARVVLIDDIDALRPYIVAKAMGQSGTG